MYLSVEYIVCTCIRCWNRSKRQEDEAEAEKKETNIFASCVTDGSPSSLTPKSRASKKKPRKKDEQTIFG